MKTIEPTTAMLHAMGRASVYGLLARAFAYPDAQQREAFAELTGGDAHLPSDVLVEAVALALAMPPPAELEEAYGRLFTHSSSRDCPTFETAYAAKEIFQQTQQMADIAGFYRAFGVEVVPGGDRADHICAELEFMQLLAVKEAYAYQHLGVARVRQCQKAQRLFLRDHLGGWGPAFGRRVEARDPQGWYGQAGRLLHRWLVDECHALAVTPVRRAEEPVLPWPEPEEDGPDTTLIAPDGELDECGGCPITVAAEAPPADVIPLRLVE